MFDVSIDFHLAIGHIQIVLKFRDIHLFIAFEALASFGNRTFGGEAEHRQTMFCVIVFLVQFAAQVWISRQHDGAVFQNRISDLCFGESFGHDTSFRRHLTFRRQNGREILINRYDLFLTAAIINTVNA